MNEDQCFKSLFLPYSTSMLVKEWVVNHAVEVNMLHCLFVQLSLWGKTTLLSKHFFLSINIFLCIPMQMNTSTNHNFKIAFVGF